MRLCTIPHPYLLTSCIPVYIAIISISTIVPQPPPQIIALSNTFVSACSTCMYMGCTCTCGFTSRMCVYRIDKLTVLDSLHGQILLLWMEDIDLKLHDNKINLAKLLLTFSFTHTLVLCTPSCICVLSLLFSSLSLSLSHTHTHTHTHICIHITHTLVQIYTHTHSGLPLKL